VRALVTGSCGFVGKYLTTYLLEKGDEVLGTTFSSTDFSNTKEKVSHARAALDVNDEKACKELVFNFAPEVIYHLAGVTFVPEAEKNFSQALNVNVAGTHNILKAAASLPSEVRCLYVSSADVYGRISDSVLPIREDCSPNPVNNYSLSKLMAEFVCKRFADEKNLKIIIARPFNHIGPGQGDQFVASSFASQLAKIKKGLNKPVMKVGNLEASRDFSHVRDIVAGYRLAVEKTTFLDQSNINMFNFSSGRAVSIQSLLDNLLEISGLEVDILQDPARMRPSDVPVLYGSYEKAKIELGWEPERKIYDTLNEIYKYWIEQLN